MNRPCPNCNTHELEQTRLVGHSREVLHCPACNGLWLDSKALEALLVDPVINLDIPRGARRDGRLCPACKKALRTFSYPGTFVMVDMCEACHGIWLDGREFEEMDAVRIFAQKTWGKDTDAPREEAPLAALKQRLLLLIEDHLSGLYSPGLH